MTCDVDRSSGVDRLSGEKAEKHTDSLRCLSEILSDQQKDKMGINTGSAFPLWSKMTDEKGLRG